MPGHRRSSATSARKCLAGLDAGTPVGGGTGRASGAASRRSWASQMRRHSSAQWSRAHSSICVRTHIVIACAHTYFERGWWRSLCQSCCTCLRHPGGPRPNHWRLPRHSSTHSPRYVRISRSSNGTCGTARLPAFGPAAAAREDGRIRRREPPRGRRRLGRPHARRSPFRRGRQLPLQGADVEPRYPVHPQAVHRRRQPARPGLRLRPGQGTPAWSPAQARRRLHQRGLRRGPRTCFGADFQAPYFDDWLRWAGITDVTRSTFRPNLAVDDREPGRQAAHAAARDAAKTLAPR